jgi:hypothetical protein
MEDQETGRRKELVSRLKIFGARGGKSGWDCSAFSFDIGEGKIIDCSLWKIARRARRGASLVDFGGVRKVRPPNKLGVIEG